MAGLRNTFDGGTNGSAITTGNSGGASGDAFNSVTAAVYSNTHAHSGGLSARFPASTFCILIFNMSATEVYTRAYLWVTAASAQVLQLVNAAAGGGGTAMGRINMLANGTLEVGDSSGSVTNLGATGVTLNQWVRIEGRFSTTTGCEARLYNSADSAVISASAVHATSMSASAGSVGFRNNGTESQDAWLDDVAVSTDGWLGPAVDPAPRPPLIVPTAIHRASRW